MPQIIRFLGYNPLAVAKSFAEQPFRPGTRHCPRTLWFGLVTRYRVCGARPLHGRWHSLHPAVCDASSIRCRQGRSNSTSP